MLSVSGVVLTVILLGASTLQQSTGPTGDVDGDDCSSYPCVQGRCIDGYKNFTCECPHNYNGTLCENDLSLLGCDVENLCLNGGTCERLTDQSSNYNCHCIAGYTGSTCETEIDECRQHPCSHGICVDLINTYVCNCTGSGYQGQTCSDDVNECSALPHPCGNGSCVNNPGSFSCDCPVGFEGVGCVADVDECLSNPCRQNGTCTSGVNDFTCSCAPGYRGKQCEIDVNECESLNITCPGSNTQCVDQVNSYRCECKPGYAGLAPICRDIDECALNPCRYGATCHNLENDFLCDCPSGYNGTQCEINEDECEPNPCANGGTCEDGVNTYTCRCVPGFEGQNCTENIQECETLHVECRNGATCKDGINTFVCECGTGWTGRFCDVDIDDCASNPCANGATCHNFNNYYNCTCLPGFTGFNCTTNIDDCQPNPCQNNGSCIDGINDYSCNCSRLWMGRNCTESYDACIDMRPCQNEGTCYSEPPSQTYNCTCLSGFLGDNCQTNFDNCVNNNCESYQECIDGIGNYTCGCPRGYSGPTCNTPINECDSNPCVNGGTCHDGLGNYTCSCPQNLINLTIYTPGRTNEFWSGWTGRNCDVDINECNASVPACLRDGICQNDIGGYTCYCKNSDNLNLGRNCESVSSYCKLEEQNQGGPPCQHGGTCVDGTTAGSYDCICAPGYSGVTCDEDIDECMINPCQQNGTCYDGINSYNCSCVPGFTGTNCEININECWPYNPCLNYGTCIDRVNSYECECADTGFVGEQCQDNIDDCLGVACLHGGTCVDGIKEYACACYPGYTGKDCETDIDECLSSPCQYNGTCVERSKSKLYPVYQQLTDFSYATASGYACICIPGITGSDCETNIDDCENHPCQNGATCADLINAFKCDCAPGYEGQYCQIDIDECDLYGACRNGATCQDMVNDYSCHCPPFQRDTVTYGGKNCTVELVGCQKSSVLCQNGATCIPELEDERHGYSCLCPPGFTGRYCNTSTTVSFANGARIMKQNVQDFEIEFRFRTTLKSAVLMAYQPRQGVYISVEIMNEHLYAAFGDETTSVKSRRVMTRSKVNDADMHTVYVMIISNITLRVESSMCNSREDCTISLAFPQTFSTSQPKLFIGNTDQTVFPSTYPNSSFTGCMEDIIYNSSDYLMPSLPANAQYTDIEEGCDRREQCGPYTCNRHGDCLDLWNEFRCDCFRPYLGQTCGQEYTPATFFKDNVQSWASFVIPQNYLVQIQNDTKLSLFIRTRQSNGLIMYFGNDLTTVNSRTYIALEIKNGKLSAIFNFCSKSYVIESSGSYNDGEAHFIQLDMTTQNISFSINANTNINQFHEGKVLSDVRCLFGANVAYFGGKVPDTLVMSSRRRRQADPVGTLGNPNFFKGIIQDVQMNGIKLQFYPVDTPVGDSLVMTSSTNLTEGRNSTEQACDAMPCQQNGTCTDIFYNDFMCECPYGYRGKDCSELDFCRNATCPDGSTCQSLHNGYECVSSADFDGNTNLVGYRSNLNPSTSIDSIDVRLRTEVMYGALLYIQRDQYFMKLRIAGGHVQLNYKLKDEISRQLNVQYMVNDGILYDVGLTTSENTINIQIKQNATILKEASVTVDSPITNLTELIQNSAIYLGGIGQPRSQRSWEQPYKGCLEEVRIAGFLLPFYPESFFQNNNMRTEYFSVSNIYNIQHGCTYNTPRPVVEGIGRNGGTCHQMLNGDYVCTCLPGFTGPFCEVNIDDCSPGICQNGGICIDGVESFMCKCRKGYKGSRCQDDENYCNGTVCNNNGSCRELETGFECNCTPDFTGITCDTTLNQSCTSGLCQNGGTCNDINRTISGEEVGSFNCTCQAGYEGPLCDRPIDYCQNLPCGANGNCTSPPDSQTFTCDCDPGFTGTKCETNINNCANMCQNGGTCSDLVNDYNCTCPDGWTGRQCTEDVNECIVNICQHGTCQNTNGGYICNCNNTGYDGPNCDDQVNECETIGPCKNGGSCNDTEGSYNCSCTLGYEGQNCEIPDCSAGQCLNGATCRVNEAIWECDCVQYYEGTQCETAGPCLNQTCNISNTDQCIQDIISFNYTCSCKSGWKGDNCEENIDECSDGNNGGCTNGATCRDTDGSYECQCVAGYTGRLCETNIDDCAGENPCQNDGKCIDRVNNFTCNCVGTGYEGDTCTVDIDECETGTAECTENTVCRNTEGSYQCPCKQGFIGDSCVKDPCLETICEHDGSCNSSATEEGDYTATCFCKEGYEGSRCEKIGASKDSGINIWYIIGPVIAVVLLIIIIGIVIFVMMARTKRATRGTYSPSRQETSGARVELGNVLKKPPEERLI